VETRLRQGETLPQAGYNENMGIRTAFVPNEWYHCYNRGVDKRRTYDLVADYDRFLTLLYVCNGDKTVHLSNLRDTALISVLQDEKMDRGEPLVDIAAYCLMPNHTHLILRQLQDNGIPVFMQKVFTAYTMYYNRRHRRTGALFAGVFKSKHLHDDRYLKRAVPYVLLNPAELVAPRWKEGFGAVAHIEKEIRRYTYSSAPEFFGSSRIHSKIVGQGIKEFYDSTPTLRELLTEAQEYYRQAKPAV
jgi:REP element-mobilizing transposase RayT